MYHLISYGYAKWWYVYWVTLDKHKYKSEVKLGGETSSNFTSTAREIYQEMLLRVYAHQWSASHEGGYIDGLIQERRNSFLLWWRNQMETLSTLLPFVWGIHRSPVNSPHKGRLRRALMLSLIYACTNGCINDRNAGDLRRHRAHYDVTVMLDYCLFDFGHTYHWHFWWL